MKLEVTIGCAICGFTHQIYVDSQIDCDNLICPKCGNENCLSIIAVSEDSAFKKENILQRLQRIRQL